MRKIAPNKLTRGFTLIELIIVMAIFSTLVGLATISLANTERNTSISSEINKIIPDIKQQQIKAMAGDSEGSGAVNDYGIHFGSTSYTLYRGTYVAGNSSNFVVQMSPNITISGSDMTFIRGSGELSGATTFVLTDTTNGSTKTVSVNKYGAITGIN